MSRVTFGYQLVQGAFRPHPENAEKIRRLFENYRNGMTVRKAGEAAGIQKSNNSLLYLMKNEVYLGNDLFPQIIDQALFHEVAEIRAAHDRELRKKMPAHNKRNSLSEIMINTEFQMIPYEDKLDMDPVEFVQYAYSHIHPLGTSV